MHPARLLRKPIAKPWATAEPHPDFLGSSQTAVAGTFRLARVGQSVAMTYRRHNHDNIHVRGYKEEGTTTTPFDMVVLNNLDRYQLALDAIQRIPRLADQREKATARYWTTMERHKLYISEHGDDMPEVRDWRWSL